MTSWTPKLDGRSGPIYQAIVSALADDVASGRLPQGSRLPTHRELADALGVTVGTITRAYTEAHRRQLISGEVGRGTFVKGASDTAPLWRRAAANPNIIDLSTARSTAPLLAESVSRQLKDIAADPKLGSLLDYRLDSGSEAHREVLAEWAIRCGVPADPNQLLITSGAEHAISVVFQALTHPGDTVLCEALTYPNVKYIAAAQNVRLQGLAMDEQGVLPAAFEAACKAGPVRAIYLIPTLQNPTSTVLPVERRRQIAAIAKAHDVIIIEDNVFGFLEPEPPLTIASIAPERTVHLTSFSKLMAGGLRVGYIVAPPHLVQRIGYALHVNIIFVAPLLVELVVRLIKNGTADQQVERQRSSDGPLHARLPELLGGLEYQSRVTSSIVWLTLPDHWQSEAFAAAARDRGILVSPAPHFHAGRGDPPNAVRIGLGGARGQDLERSLVTLAQLARSIPQDTLRIV